MAIVLSSVLFWGTVGSTLAADTGRKTLPGHVPVAVARFHLQPIGDLPVTNRLSLAIGLPLRNQDGLNALLREIYDPASPNYHHYLTPQAFTEKFGSTESDYDAVVNFAKMNGLKVTATYPNRALVDVSGDTATVEKAFHVTLRVYQHPTENRNFFAPDSEPSIGPGIPILHVSGLDNFTIPRPALIKKNLLKNDLPGVAPASGSGPDGLYMGNDFRAAYVPGTALDGAGQVVGLLELNGYYTNDIVAYENQAGLPDITLTNIPIDGFNESPGSDTNEIIEVSLDIEMAICMATNLSTVMVYEEQNGGNIVDLLNRMVSDNLAKQISSSWLIGDDASYDTAYLQMAAQGQSFFQASGDEGAFYSGIAESSDDANVTLVGGTTLSTATNGAWSSETAWNWSITEPPNVGATGGGISLNNIAIPSWQQGINMTVNQGSTTLRNIPDVALTADNIFVIAANTSFSVGGTSAAAPLWAGFAALINQQAVTLGKPTVGFLNPAIYAIGNGGSYTLNFHDITTGNNTNASVLNEYFAVPGYDLCTGWGTPNGQNLINTLVPPDALIIAPESGFNASGPAGGPFNPAVQNFSLTNVGASALTWSLINTSAWLNASASSGTLAAGATNGIVISLTAAANSLALGTYAAVVVLSNWNTSVTQNLPFTLQALQPLVVTPAVGFTAAGPAGGPFNVTTQNFSVTNIGTISLNWSLINTSAWLTVAGGGALGAGAAITATASLSSAATNLTMGIYTANVWFTNQTSGGAQSVQFTLLVNQSLVQNGGFETGDFTDWTLAGDGSPDNFVDNGSYSGIPPHSGAYEAVLGEPNVQAYLSQTLPTVAAQQYLLSLWLYNPLSATITEHHHALETNNPNEFSVSWNGNTLYDQANFAAFTWSNLQFVVTATTANTVLQLGGRDDDDYLGLDDVSVLPIPAAFQAGAVTVTNNNLEFNLNTLTGVVYQVQSATNLLQTNWLVLKTITATNATTTFVDPNPVTAAPQKFYRLLLLP